MVRIPSPANSSIKQTNQQDDRYSLSGAPSSTVAGRFPHLRHSQSLYPFVPRFLPLSRSVFACLYSPVRSFSLQASEPNHPVTEHQQNKEGQVPCAGDTWNVSFFGYTFFKETEEDEPMYAQLFHDINENLFTTNDELRVCLEGQISLSNEASLSEEILSMLYCMAIVRMR
ncbi:hypothetical protein PIB30_081743 [Stylosanthes scabra]|uniref:Uncharacterized protein n=1 Tax=Stylosanthes scabra TaxID=79078 RepID=A0ABU6WRQ1_9FABA|nr:hypothetical protein [Stylosanthes scabra]